MVSMASAHTVKSKTQIRKQFRKGLQILLDTFRDTVLLYTQYFQVVNFTNINKGHVNVIIIYKSVQGWSVKLEALGEIDDTYVHTLDFIWQAMRRAAQEALSDYSSPFTLLTLPTQNDLLKVLPELLM